VAVFAELHRKNRLLRRQEEKVQAINADLLRLNRELEQRVLDRTLALENLNQELQALNISKDKFLSVMSHDLRNPLTALLASSGKLSEAPENLSPGQVRQLSQIIHRTSNKLLNQLNEVIEWAKKQSRKTSFNPEKVRLADGAEESLEVLKPNAQQKKISIQNHIPKDMEVMADPLMLRSIVQNLVTNAIKYTPEGGRVRLSAKMDAQMACVFVEDSGVGMDGETTARLFRNTDQKSLVGTNNEPGSGLGLLLVSDFVTQHGGRINVESTLGSGTTICFTIPAILIESQ
jgi:signal transduction histidine kinase